MPFNGAGSYTPPGADFPAVTGLVISSTKYNDLINDIATALSLCITKDGQQVITADIPMASHKLTGLSAGAGNGDSVRFEQIPLAASIAQMVAAAVITAFSTPNRQHYHPAHPKAWAFVDVDGNILDSYGISGVTHPGTGIWQATWNPNFSSANYGVIAIPVSDSARYGQGQNTGYTAAHASVNVRDAAGTLADVNHLFIAAFGTLV